MAARDARAKLERERLRLVLAESDMKQVATAAAHLAERGSQMNSEAERVMLTGLVVTYARPYSRSNKVGAIKGDLAEPESPALKVFHDQLLRRRDDVFAHNDRTPFRTAVKVQIGTGEEHHVEEYAPIDPGAYAGFERLAKAQRERFRARLNEIGEELRLIEN